MVEFIRPVNPGASPVANLSNRYFRPLLDDTESRALGQLANALARQRSALSGLASSVGGVASAAQGLSNAALSAQQQQLRDMQRQYDLQNQRDRLSLQQEQNQFNLWKAEQDLAVQQARVNAANAQEAIGLALDADFSGPVDNSFLGLLSSRPGNSPVSPDPFSGSVQATGAAATSFVEQYGQALEQVAAVTGANLTVTDASVSSRTVVDSLPDQNASGLGGMADMDPETRTKLRNIFGEGALGAQPQFKTVEDSIRYMGFYLQHHGVANGTVEDAVRVFFGLNTTGAVEATPGASEAVLSLYQRRMQMLDAQGLSADASLADNREQFARAMLVDGVSELDELPVGKLVEEGINATKTGRLIRNNSGQFKVFAGDREEYGAMKDGERRVSLDFNSAPDIQGGFYAMVVVPDDATGEELQAARGYVQGMKQLMAEYGYDDYGIYGDDGLATRSENGRGKPGTFHTEPFFAEDPRAVELLGNPEFMAAYAELVKDTLGEIPGAVLMAPHTEQDGGATVTLADGRTLTEREFALTELIPLLDGPSAKQHTVDISADDGSNPIPLSDGSPASMTVKSAAAAYGVPINNGNASDVLSIGAGGETPDVFAMAYEGPNARAAEAQTALEQLDSQLRDRVQRAIAIARQDDDPNISANAEAFVQGSPQYRAMLRAYSKARGDIFTELEQGIVEDQQNALKDYVFDQGTQIAALIDAETEAGEFGTVTEAMRQANRNMNEATLNLMAGGRDDMREVLAAEYAGRFNETPIGKAIARAEVARAKAQRGAQLTDAAVSEFFTRVQSGEELRPMLENHSPKTISNMIDTLVNSAKTQLDAFEMNPEALTFDDVREMARSKQYLQTIMDDPLASNLNSQDTQKIKAANDRLTALQADVVEAAALAEISGATSPDAIIAAHSTALDVGMQFGLDADYRKTIGEDAATGLQELEDQQLLLSNATVTTKYEYDTGLQQLIARQEPLTVEQLNKRKRQQTANLAAAFTSPDATLEQRTAVLQESTALGINLGSRLINDMFGEASTYPDTQAEFLAYDELHQAIAASGADPIKLFGNDQPIHMLVALRYQPGQRAHDVLREVVETADTVPPKFVDALEVVNFARAPSGMRDQVRAAVLLQAIEEVQDGATEAEIANFMDKNIDKVLYSRKFSVAGFAQPGFATTAEITVRHNIMQGEKIYSKPVRAFLAAALAQKTQQVLADIRAEDPSDVVPFNLNDPSYIIDIAGNQVVLTQEKGGAVNEISGRLATLLSDDNATAQARSVRLVETGTDLQTGGVVETTKDAVFLDSPYYLDLSSVSEITVKVADGERGSRSLVIPVSELRPTVTSAGAALLNKRGGTPVPKSEAVVGYYFVLPEGETLFPGEIEIDDIPLSAGLDAPIGLSTEALMRAADDYTNGRIKVLD